MGLAWCPVGASIYPPADAPSPRHEPTRPRPAARRRRWGLVRGLGSVTCDAFSKFRVPVNWASRDTKRARPLLSCHLADLGSQTGLVSREVAYPAPLPCLTRAPTPSSRHPRSTAGVGPQCPGYSRSRAPKRSSPCLTHHHLRWRHHHQPACPSTPPHDRFGASVGAQLASAMATFQPSDSTRGTPTRFVVTLPRDVKRRAARELLAPFGCLGKNP